MRSVSGFFCLSQFGQEGVRSPGMWRSRMRGQRKGSAHITPNGRGSSPRPRGGGPTLAPPVAPPAVATRAGWLRMGGAVWGCAVGSVRVRDGTREPTAGRGTASPNARPWTPRGRSSSSSPPTGPRGTSRCCACSAASRTGSTASERCTSWRSCGANMERSVCMWVGGVGWAGVGVHAWCMWVRVYVVCTDSLV